jgi:hypothetical protein
MVYIVNEPSKLVIRLCGIDVHFFFQRVVLNVFSRLDLPDFRRADIHANVAAPTHAKSSRKEDNI